VALLAVGMGIFGLIAAADTITPYALRAAGKWRPTGTFQYAPALALLVVSALPVLLAAMARASRLATMLAAGAAGAVAGATLALSESRTQLGFALLVCAAAVALPGHLGGARRTVAAAVALVAAAGLGAHAVAGGYIPVTPPPDGAARGLGLSLVVALAAAAWPAVRLGLRRGLPVVALCAALLAAGATAVAVKPAPRLLTSGLVGAQERPAPKAPAKDPIRDQLLHGRLDIWGEALATFADRPLHGGGADSYLFASAPHQGERNVYYAHQLPLELAAELGVAGLLLGLALYAALLRVLARARGATAGLLWPAAAAFPAANLVDWPWHLAGSGAVWALALGALLGVSGATRTGD
jgi:O-antigen ligase